MGKHRGREKDIPVKHTFHNFPQQIPTRDKGNKQNVTRDSENIHRVQTRGQGSDVPGGKGGVGNEGYSATRG